ncbi:MAG: hypothetical protein ACO1OB_31025, partial [Archangium sp.]
PAGGGPGGDACPSDAQCRSNYCVLDDSRGVRRSGACAAFCGDANECSGDAGVTCEPRSFLVSRGRDGVANTADDISATKRACVGASCAVDADCGPSVCSLQRDAVNEAALTQRCAPATTGTKRGGEGCISDVECRSGACGTLQPPSTGIGRACFEACVASTTCAIGQSCRVNALLVAAPLGTVAVTSCAP